MITTTTSPPEDDNNGLPFGKGKARHQLGKEKNDGSELTEPSVEGNSVDENQPSSAEKHTETHQKVTPKNRDLFDDLEALGRPIDEILGSEKLLTSLEVRKPKRDEWVRLHQSISARVYVYENKDEMSWHLIAPNLVEPLQTKIRYVQLSLAVNYNGRAFVWPVPIPTARKPHRSSVSAFAGAEKARQEWICICWGKDQYDVSRRSSATAVPVWPSEIVDSKEMLRFLVKTGSIEVIDSLEHPVARALLGHD